MVHNPVMNKTKSTPEKACFYLQIADTKFMRKDISVVAIMNSSGQIVPLSIIWNDGRKFDVDRVLEIKKAASTKGGGMGLRYTCKILGKEKFLWLDGYVWFVEIEDK